jgi:flagellar protein FlgJ
MPNVIHSFNQSSLVKPLNVVNKTEEAAIKFEQFFIKSMLDNAKRTLPGDGLIGQNEQRDMMMDMQNQAIAEHLATSKSFGIADLLIQQANMNK